MLPNTMTADLKLTLTSLQEEFTTKIRWGSLFWWIFNPQIEMIATFYPWYGTNFFYVFLRLTHQKSKG